MRNVAHRFKPFRATSIIAGREREQCFAERSEKGLLRMQGQHTIGLGAPEQIEDALHSIDTACPRKRHHRMRDIKRPRIGEILIVPAVGELRPSLAQLKTGKLQAPKQRRCIGEFRDGAGAGNLRVVYRKRGLRVTGIEVKKGSVPGQMDGKARIRPRRFARGKKFKPLARAPLHLHCMNDHVHGAGMSRIDLKCAAREFFRPAELTVLFQTERI